MGPGAGAGVTSEAAEGGAGGRGAAAGRVSSLNHIASDHCNAP